jgi:CHAD domain-containing protein
MTPPPLKFHVDPARFAGLVAALGKGRLERVPLLVRYLDTQDGLLSRHHMTLRLCREQARWTQTLAGPGPRGLGQREDGVPVHDGGSGACAWEVDPGRHQGTPLGDSLLDLLERHAHPALVEVGVADVTRIRRRLRSRAAQVEWALDEGTIHAGQAVHAVSELELRFTGGDPAGLFALAMDWQGQHGLWLDVVPRSQRIQLLREGRLFCKPASSGAPSWHRKAARALDGNGMLRALVSTCLVQILPNAGEIAAGSTDPEHVHQLRVGLRRLRSVVREMAPFTATLGVDWEEAVRHVFAELGSLRDHQVFLASLAPQLRRDGAPIADFAPEPHRDPPDLMDLVRGTAFQRSLLELLAFVHGAREAQPGDRPPASGGQPALEYLGDRLTRLQRQVLRDGGHFELLGFEEQHRVRKRLKRLRYIAALIGPLFPSRQVEAWLGEVKPVQEALGRHVDLLVAARRFREEAEHEPRAWFAAGWLQAQSSDSAGVCRKCLERLKRAKAFW